MDDFKSLPPLEQLRLLEEQKDAERRGRGGPLGGNKYDSRDLDEVEERLRRAGLLPL